MWKKIGIALLLITLIAAAAACATQQQAKPQTEQPAPSTQTEVKPPPVQETGPLPEEQPALQPVTKPDGPIEAVWIEPQIEGDTVTIPVSELEQNWNVNFKVDDLDFMAYILDEEIYVRANVCPPCRSVGFSLSDDTLVCERCATTFEADTGAGIGGACVDFPKASVAYKLSDGTIRMQKADLAAAYEETLQPG